MYQPEATGLRLVVFSLDTLFPGAETVIGESQIAQLGNQAWLQQLRKALTGIRRRCQTAAIAKGFTREFRASLQAAGLLDLFDEIAGGVEPDDAVNVVQQMMEFRHLGPNQTLHVTADQGDARRAQHRMQVLYIAPPRRCDGQDLELLIQAVGEAKPDAHAAARFRGFMDGVCGNNAIGRACGPRWG